MKLKSCVKCKEIKNIICFYINKQTKDGYSCYCKECQKEIKKEQRKCKPWLITFQKIQERCNNINCQSYKDYGGRGIKNYLTKEQLKELWFRDKAWLLNEPSIDRIDNDGDYIYWNCQYIELQINRGKDRKISVLQFTKEGEFIKEWESVSKASGELKLFTTLISRVLKGKRKTHGGFGWKYREENI